jgi:hypothetical protein
MHTNGIRMWTLLSAIALGACLAQPAAADSTRFDFTLTHSGLPPDFPSMPDGGGFFVIDDPIPATGTIVLLASDLAGTVGGSQFFPRPQPFGYAYGNTHEYFVGPPPDNNIAVTRTPHEDARITFTDGVATGIAYMESHTCDTGHHCRNGFSDAASVFMSGSFYEAGGVYPSATGGVLTIAPAVPEPGVQALLLAGIAGLGLCVGIPQVRACRLRCMPRAPYARRVQAEAGDVRFRV